jgi:hypothetical protein
LGIAPDTIFSVPPLTGCPATGVVDVGCEVGTDVGGVEEGGTEVGVDVGCEVGCDVGGGVVVVDFSPQPLKINTHIRERDKKIINNFFIFSPR